MMVAKAIAQNRDDGVISYNADSQDREKHIDSRYIFLVNLTGLDRKNSH